LRIDAAGEARQRGPWRWSCWLGPRHSRVNARDRIGKGPWQNFKGTVIAKDVDDLHGPAGTAAYWG
jgi:hypothetical protein